MSDVDFYKEILTRHRGSSIGIDSIQSVSGGCINITNRVVTSKGSFFVKINTPEQKDLFKKEVKGLEMLKSKSPVNTPEIVGSGEFSGRTYLILEWINKEPPGPNFWNDFGQRLALQHKVSHEFFGLDHDNHIGRLSQSNKFYPNWYDLFINERILPQLDLGEQNGFIDIRLRKQFDLLFAKLDQLIPTTLPSLLHGDLWSGNFLCGPETTPYIFDPAIYFGHRETELAFTSLFGGFDQIFYTSYIQEFPPEPGYDERFDIHNLYPLLVHVNLFGSSYLSGIRTTLKRIL
ncbi:MAG: fructosamine kinase family protein [Cyclobacteriaceae bacterium]